VTKAVSDSFGGAGIADEMIRFNGYPFLEKEDKDSGDHAFIEPSELGPQDVRESADQPVGNVMKRGIVMMRADGMPIQEIGELNLPYDRRRVSS
jgi:chloride channel 3/4/5